MAAFDFYVPTTAIKRAARTSSTLHFRFAAIDLLQQTRAPERGHLKVLRGASAIKAGPLMGSHARTSSEHLARGAFGPGGWLEIDWTGPLLVTEHVDLSGDNGGHSGREFWIEIKMTHRRQWSAF